MGGVFALLVVVGLFVAVVVARRRHRRTVARRDLLSTTFTDRTAGFPRMTGRGGL